jgi:hypothetical protein
VNWVSIAIFGGIMVVAYFGTLLIVKIQTFFWGPHFDSPTQKKIKKVAAVTCFLFWIVYTAMTLLAR